MLNERQTIYVAAPLFSESELMFNRIIKKILLQKFNVYLPQEDGELLNDTVVGGGDIKSASERIFSSDIEAIKNSDILLLVLDGRSIDEGAAFELGIAYAYKKICIGLQTDPRRLLPTGNNPMITCSISHIFTSIDDLRLWIESSSKIHSLFHSDFIDSQI